MDFSKVAGNVRHRMVDPRTCVPVHVPWDNNIDLNEDTGTVGRRTDTPRTCFGR